MTTIDAASGMTPHEHIQKAEQLLAQAYGVDGPGYDSTRVAAAQVHVAIAMFLRMEPAVDAVVDPPQVEIRYDVSTRRKESAA